MAEDNKNLTAYVAAGKAASECEKCGLISLGTIYLATQIIYYAYLAWTKCHGKASDVKAEIADIPERLVARCQRRLKIEARRHGEDWDNEKSDAVTRKALQQVIAVPDTDLALTCATFLKA